MGRQILVRRTLGRREDWLLCLSIAGISFAASGQDSIPIFLPVLIPGLNIRRGVVDSGDTQVRRRPLGGTRFGPGLTRPLALNNLAAGENCFAYRPRRGAKIPCAAAELHSQL